MINEIQNISETEESTNHSNIINNIPVEPENAPPIIGLTHEEGFKDSEGNIIKITVRGIKYNEDLIFFRVKDISFGFNMPKLHDTLLNYKNYKYETNSDYKFFYVSVNTTSKGNDTNIKIEKQLYLTYSGLLRVLFISRNKNSDIFRKWATTNLFTSQMGSKEEKFKLGTDIANINLKTYKAVFETYASKLPSIYLFLLGKVSLLRETFGIDQNISDESSVYKYGCTDDLNRRFGETDAKYGKLPNVSVKISVFNMVDVKYIFNAERDIRELGNSNGIHLNIEGYNELIILDDKQLKQIKKQYQYIGNEWAGASLELQNQITELKEKIKDLENENNILQKQNTLEKTELKHIIELKDRDILSRDKELETNKRINELELMNKDLQIKMLSS